MEKLKGFARYAPKTVTAKQMRAIELNSEALGVPVSQLMENAGVVVANFVESRFPKAKNIMIVSGLGNNGGDGFAAAKRLRQRHNVVVGIAGKKEEVKEGPALENLRDLEGLSLNIIEDVHLKPEITRGNDLLIVGLFGTGFHGKVQKEMVPLIRELSSSKVPVVSIDLPSGLDATTGKGDTVVKSAYTVVLHKMKSGLLKAKSAGKTIVSDIGIPVEAELLAGPGDLLLASRPRSLYASKKENGRVMIIAGSSEYHGAPALAANAVCSALAALRIGTGYVFLYVPKSIEAAVRKLSPSVIVKRFGSEYINDGNISQLRNDVQKADSIVIGMGLGRNADVLATAASIIRDAVSRTKKIVIDADALFALKSVRNLGPNTVLTPQDREFRELSGAKLPAKDLARRAESAVKLAKRLNASVLLKGHETIVTNGELVKIVRSESSALATMGTGDVLSGIIAGYAATGASIFEAAVAGAYLHAMIGDALAREKGTHILAVDVVDYIPKVLKEFDKSAE